MHAFPVGDSVLLMYVVYNANEDELFSVNTDFDIYRRDGVNVEISKYKEITRTVARNTDPLLTVSRTPDKKLLVMTGTRYAPDPRGAIVVGIAFGGYLVYSIALSAYHLADAQGSDLYYYSSIDPASGELHAIDFTESPGIRSVTDKYQFSSNNEAREDSKKE